jgi:Uma2 family endonuclease
MHNMSTRATDYLDAINHLPDGATLVFHDVGWREYDELLQGLSERPHLRVSYNSGRLEIVSPLPEHEYFARLIGYLIHIVSEEFDIEIEDYGSTTWKREKLGKGAEADLCFYVASAKRLKDRIHIDLESDPPPDIVVELDTTNESSSKFPIYHALMVPEIWQYDGKRMQFYELSGKRYKEVSDSRSIPGLKPAILASALDRSKNEGQTTTLRKFRQELRKK